MDTKLKNYRNKYVKALAFAITALLLSATGLLFLETVLKTNGNMDSIFSQNYLRSGEFGNDIQLAAMQVEEGINNLPKDLIKGSFYTNSQGFLEYNNGKLDPNQKLSSDMINLEDLTVSIGISKPSNLSKVDYDFYYKNGDLEISNIDLNQLLKYQYFIGIGENEQELLLNPNLSEIDKDSIRRNPYLSYFQGGNLEILSLQTSNEENYESILYLGYPDEVVEKAISEYENLHNNTSKAFRNGLTMIITSLVLYIYLCVTCGRNPEDDDIHLWKIDKLWGEINLFALAALVYSYVGILVVAYDATYQKIFSEGTVRLVVFGSSMIVVSLAGMFWLSLCRKFKHKPRRYMFLLTGKALDLAMIPMKKLWTFAKTLPPKFKKFFKKGFGIIKYFDSKLYSRFPVTQKIHRLSYLYLGLMIILVFFAIVFGLSYLGLFTLACIGAMIYLTLVFIKKSKENFEEINQGFDKGYKESLKAEKMRVDLITNVSHDLKTPLTSIISYADLLKNEEMSDVAKDYVEILDKKAKRLNVIVGDLFDLSKSTSGNLSFDLENINLKKLIEQTYADMEDKISTSELKFILQLPEEPVNIYADGKKMYRVFQNLFDNALKYSLNKTRVYVTLEHQDKVATATIKNIAAYEMNFTEEEIAERFTRGDSSRTTEGSGLGLSIAESFTQNCHGKFKINIDGDLFKVSLSFQTI